MQQRVARDHDVVRGRVRLEAPPRRRDGRRGGRAPRRSGVKRAASRCQFRSPTSGRPAGRGRRARSRARCCSSASVCTVLPRPMSSARQAPRPQRPQEVEPGHPALLIGTQRALEASGRRQRFHGRLALELLQQVVQPARRSHAVERQRALLRGRAERERRSPRAPVSGPPLRFQTASAARISSAVTCTQRPRKRTSGSLAAASASSSVAGQLLAAQRHLELELRQRVEREPRRRSSCAAGGRRRAPSGAARGPPRVHHDGSSTPKPACSSAPAPCVRNSCAPRVSRSRPAGAAACRLASMRGKTAAARPSDREQVLADAEAGLGQQSRQERAALPRLLGGDEQARVRTRLQEEPEMPGLLLRASCLGFLRGLFEPHRQAEGRGGASRRPGAASSAPAPPGPRATHRCRAACRRASAGRPPSARARWRSRSPVRARRPGGRASPPWPPRTRRWRGSRSGVGRRVGVARAVAFTPVSASAARGAAWASRVKARAASPGGRGPSGAWNAARSRAMPGTKWPEATSPAAKRRTAQKNRRSSPPATPGVISGFSAAARRSAIAWAGGSGMAVTVQGFGGRARVRLGVVRDEHARGQRRPVLRGQPRR